MTRINCVPVEELCDKHLGAEYYELPRVITFAERAYERGGCLDVPNSYRLGEGHMKFFYNKMPWLRNRFQQLYFEMQRRGKNIDEGKYHTVVTRFAKIIASRRQDFDWEPREEDIALNRARLIARMPADAA